MLTKGIVCLLQSTRCEHNIRFSGRRLDIFGSCANSVRYVTKSVWEDHHGASVHTDSVSGKSDPGSLSV